MSRSVFLLALALLLPASAQAGAAGACADGACFPGGGSAKKDCFAEFDGVHPNEPAPDPTKGKVKPKKEWSCFDGDAGCDLDGAVDGSCRFPVDVCLGAADPNLPECTPSLVNEVAVKAKKSADAGAGLQAALDALVPGAADVCTSGAVVDVPLKVKKNGQQKPGKVSVKVKARANAGKDGDTLKLTCLPREWPSHGYNHFNHRSTDRTTLTPANVASLQPSWSFEMPTATQPGTCQGDPQTSCTDDAACGANGPCDGETLLTGSSSTPAVNGKFVYATSWNGSVYALDRKKGKLKWSFDTGAIQEGGALGVQSSVTVVPDGRVLVGDAEGTLYALDGSKGRLLWQQDLGDPSVDHIWASPQVVNNVVLMGVASHNDSPCTQGRLVALDLDNGAVLWTTRTAPDRICEDDTRVGCTSDADCGGARCVGMCTNDASIACQDDVECGGGTCGDAVGGGVTATAAASPDGQVAYMASVGCFTSPRVGNADRMFALDMSDGSVLWAEPDLGTEAFTDGPPYRDYGFLNGPIVVAGATPAIIGASKNGNLYGRDPATGGEVFTTVGLDVLDGFASFGYFNGAPAYADGRVYASGYGFELFGDEGRCVGDGTKVCINDAACGADAPCQDIAHLRAFDAATGAPVWSETEDIGPTFGSVSEAGGVVFVGSSGIAGGASELLAFDAATGALLAQLPLPNLTSSAPAIVDGELFVGYGPSLPQLFGFGQPGAGGVAAFELP